MRVKVKEGHITRFVNLPEKPIAVSPAEAKAGTKKKPSKKTGGK